VFWLKLWNAMTFATVSIIADRALRSDPLARMRAHLLWTVNPLLLWGLIAAGHIDMIAAGAGLIGLVVLGTGRTGRTISTGRRTVSAGRRTVSTAPPVVSTAPSAASAISAATSSTGPSVGRAILGGLFLGAAADIKIPYILFAVAAAWVLRRAWRPLVAMTGAALAVLVPTYLWYGPPAVRAVLDRTTKVTADNFYQLFSSPTGFVFRHMLEFSVGFVVILAALLLWRLPRASAPALALRPALALGCAWLFVWPYQLPWYDAMIICLLILFPASRLDWIVLGRLAAGTIALIPGDPYLAAGHFIDRLNHDILALWAPILLLVSALVLAVVAAAGRWRDRQTEITQRNISKPIPAST
jgi:hypothetical protein